MKLAISPSSIRGRILLALIAAGLLPLVLMFSFSRVLTRNALVESEYEKMRSLGDEVARETARLMANIVSGVKVMAANPILVDPDADIEARFAEMQRLRTFFPLFSDISLYDSGGARIASTGGLGRKSVRDEQWFRRSLAGELAVSPPERLDGGSELFMTVFMPVIENGGASASYVISACVPFRSVADLMRDVRFGDHGIIVLLDQDGNVLAHPDGEAGLSQFDQTLSASFWQTPGRGAYVAPNGKRFFFVARTIPPERTRIGQPWILLALQPHAQTLYLLGEEQRLLVGVALVTLVALYFLGLVWSRRFCAPLIRASIAAVKVTNGELDVEVPDDGTQEVRRLAQAFNRMVREVRNHRDRLESLVAQRTLRLQQSQLELEELAAQLRASYESMTEGILMLAWPSGQIIAVNRRFSELFGVDNPGGDTSGVEIEAAIREKFVEPRDKVFRWDHYAANPTELSREEWELAKPKRITLSVYSAPVTDRQDRTFARVWVFRDLTQQRQLEDELRQAQKMEAVGRLAGGIAHDFNNLLTGILGNLSMAEMECPRTGDAPQYIASAKQAGRRASELVTQLLGFSRRSKLQLRQCNVNNVLTEVRDLLRHSVDPRLEINLATQDDLWCVSADHTQLQQVVMNLCVNAIDAMPDGGRLTLRTENVPVGADEARQWMDARPGDYVRLCVRDAGHGMTQEVQSHLFEPFFTTKAPGKGTGLGLAMSYGIVKQHGGWITCYSELNRGTTFSIYLPRTQSEEKVEPKKAQELPIAGGSENLLIVDDEAAVRSVMQSILRRYGYTSLQAADGEEALKILGEKGPDISLVLLDLTMPKLSGRDTFKKIRERLPSMPVILSSGYPIELDEFEAEMGLKVHGFVQKPYEAAGLARTVREVLDTAST